jgi:hypothetical protein
MIQKGADMELVLSNLASHGTHVTSNLHDRHNGSYKFPISSFNFSPSSYIC